MREKAVLYARISVDKSGDEVGVARQLHDLRKLAEGRDFDVVAEVTENDISASKGLAPAGLRAGVEAGARRTRRPSARVAVQPTDA